MTATHAAAVEAVDTLDWALERGTDHELALAIAAYLRNGILQHSAAAGDPVALRTADAIANNSAFGLAQMIRRAG